MANATLDAKVRESDRKYAQRKSDRDLKIARVGNPQRRLDCLADPYLYLPTYFPAVFYQPFTVDRREMIDAILHAARYGGDQAVAGPRADGKTRSALFCAMCLMLGLHVPFPLIISKSGPRANRELKNFKNAIESAIKSNAAFAEDFPEICIPIGAMGRWATAARSQTAYGIYTDMEWSEDCVIFPTITTEVLRANSWCDEDPRIVSAANEQIMSSMGIEGSIRGHSIRNRRPTLAILDDIDDRESARSETQTDTRSHIIEEDVGGLAGPDKTIARVMLCTLINRTCVAATYTDRSKKPSWKGQRHQLLLKKPDHAGLWDEYMQIRQGRSETDPDARVANQFYLDRRQEMDAGAEVTNPYRFDSRLLLDGKPSEVSALQACYNLIADRGWDHFNTEYQNDPPENIGRVESGISPQIVQKLVSGCKQGELPEGCTVLVHGVDVGKYWLHWVVRAFRPNGTGFTIDYGRQAVHGTKRGSEEGLDRALRAEVLRRVAEFRDMPYSQSIRETLTLVDAGFRTEAIYAACLEAGLGVMPVMGFGKSAGCVRISWNEVQKSTEEKKPICDGAFYSQKVISGRRFWLVCANADKWKAWEHDRWMTARDNPGCMFLWGQPAESGDRYSADERGHGAYAEQICAEVETEELVKGAMVRRFTSKHQENHWLDASYYADVAAAIRGVRIVTSAPAVRPAGKTKVNLAAPDGRSFFITNR